MNDQSPRIEGYHAHVYYDASSRVIAEQLAKELTDKFAAELGGFFDEPVGPHPVANLQIIFSTAEFASVVPWLMLNRRGLDVLIHPLTDASVRDHDADCAANDCTSNTSTQESALVLKRNASRFSHGGFGASPHGVDGQIGELTESAMGRNGPDRIGAGEKHGCPWAGAKLGFGNGFDPQQRHKQHLVTAPAQ